MRVTLDLDALLKHGEITQAEFERFTRLASHGASSLAINILIGFGVIAVSGASLALAPSAVTAIVLGLLGAASGIVLIGSGNTQWRVLANVCVLVGALLFGGGVIALEKGSVGSFLLVAAAFAAAGILARSGLLAALAVLALSGSIGAGTWYRHASYFLAIQQPTVTVAVFTLLAIIAYQASKRVPHEYEAVALAVARTAVFLVNFGFWIGSLWGERSQGAIVISSALFSALWAVALVVTGIWAWSQNRRWVLNVVAVFGGIHFYTQWFERLGASPGSVLAGGILALGFALWLRSLNARLHQQTTPA